MSDPAAPEEMPSARPDLDETPPLLGSWRNIYVVVIVNLLVLIGLFWALTEAYT
ncbi:MAG: hypothetical protein ACI9MR_003600 [Myxococcota bacterium]|jgi:hypothetical protein